MTKPIGKFEHLVDGEWVKVYSWRGLRKDGCLENKNFRFRANSGLPDTSDAPEEWWYEGDEGWTNGFWFIVELRGGCFWARFRDYNEQHDRERLEGVYETATHTPPVNKYKRLGEPDCCGRMEITWVEDQRVGDADRRKTVRVSRYPNGPTWEVCAMDEVERNLGRRKREQDRRKGEG